MFFDLRRCTTFGGPDLHNKKTARPLAIKKAKQEKHFIY
jgi:hypothetical protein